jgi:hypothetical protein
VVKKVKVQRGFSAEQMNAPFVVKPAYVYTPEEKAMLKAMKVPKSITKVQYEAALAIMRDPNESVIRKDLALCMSVAPIVGVPRNSKYYERLGVYC